MVRQLAFAGAADCLLAVSVYATLSKVDRARWARLCECGVINPADPEDRQRRYLGVVKENAAHNAQVKKQQQAQSHMAHLSSAASKRRR